jgi:hypothetical protein
MGDKSQSFIEVNASVEQILPFVIQSLRWMGANITQVVPENG